MTQDTHDMLHTALGLLREVAAAKSYDPNAKKPGNYEAQWRTLNLKADLMSRINALLTVERAAPKRMVETDGIRVPVEVVDAALRVGRWTREHNLRCWRIGDCCSEEYVAGERQPRHSKRLTREEVRSVFLANGFTIKPGHDDLKDYVYSAAFALLAAQQVK